MDLMANKKQIMDQGLCISFNLGTCPNTSETCSFKHKYFSLKSIKQDGKGQKSPRPSSPAKPLSDEEKLARSKIPCPFQARGLCSFGDKCHYSHSAPLTGDANVPATVAQAATVPSGVSVLAACASMPVAGATTATHTASCLQASQPACISVYFLSAGFAASLHLRRNKTNDYWPKE